MPALTLIVMLHIHMSTRETLSLYVCYAFVSMCIQNGTFAVLRDIPGIFLGSVSS